MIRTLFISPQVPYPLDAGSKIRIHHLLEAYRGLGPVTLVCFAHDQTEIDGIAHLADRCDTVVCTPYAAPPRRGSATRELFLRTIDPEPNLVRSFRSPELQARATATLANRQFDLLHVCRLSMTAAEPLFRLADRPGRRAYRVIDLDDLESDKVRRLAALDPWRAPRKYLRLLDWAKLRRFERRMLGGFDRILVCSERDRSAVGARLGSSVIDVFSNGTDLNAAGGAPRRDDGRTLAFLGAMSYQPNEDAVLHFAEAILPLIRAQVPDVRFVIGGKAPSRRVQRLHDGSRVVVTGYVADPQEIFTSATVFVVPLRIGGGTRIKILQAMSAGAPVVSTSVGSEGLDVTNRVDILVADGAGEFAHACVDLLNNPTRRTTLADAGRSLVQQRYGWAGIRERYAASVAADLRERLKHP